ncbi:hypothetical protein Droror1_Dr00004455 [Drosera rotundifolia]
MANLRLDCERNISIQDRNADSAVVSFRESLRLIKTTSQQVADRRVQLGKLEGLLGEAEGELVKLIEVKTSKEARRNSIVDTITSTNVRVEELKRNVQELKARKEEYASVVSQLLDALASSEERIKQDARRRDGMEEALVWFSRVLGFQIEGGHGVKFIFTNINKDCPTEEFSFRILHADDMYRLLDCTPHLDDIEDLVHVLNKSNQLFGFVRMMRAKFMKAVASGSSPLSTPPRQDSKTISTSLPVSSVVTDDISGSIIPKGEHKFSNAGPQGDATLLVASPTSGLPVRRSVRIQVKGRRKWGTRC